MGFKVSEGLVGDEAGGTHPGRRWIWSLEAGFSPGPAGERRGRWGEEGVESEQCSLAGLQFRKRAHAPSRHPWLILRVQSNLNPSAAFLPLRPRGPARGRPSPELETPQAWRVSLRKLGLVRSPGEYQLV